jgi:hypothetical protein
VKKKGHFHRRNLNSEIADGGEDTTCIACVTFVTTRLTNPYDLCGIREIHNAFCLLIPNDTDVKGN